MDAKDAKLLAKAKTALSGLQKVVQQKLDDTDEGTDEYSELEEIVSFVDDAIDNIDNIEV
jgi:uncharacterized protein YgfB (UPF0149 family)